MIFITDRAEGCQYPVYANGYGSIDVLNEACYHISDFICKLNPLETVNLIGMGSSGSFIASWVSKQLFDKGVKTCFYYIPKPDERQNRHASDIFHYNYAGFLRGVNIIVDDCVDYGNTLCTIMSILKSETPRDSDSFKVHGIMTTGRIDGITDDCFSIYKKVDFMFARNVNDLITCKMEVPVIYKTPNGFKDVDFSSILKSNQPSEIVVPKVHTSHSALTIKDFDFISLLL